jgi:translation initiation factor IF-3
MKPGSSSASWRRNRPWRSHASGDSTWWRFRRRRCRRCAVSPITGATEQKRARQARKHQTTIVVKEIKFRPKVDEHDYQFKKKHIERFLIEGDKVKATVFFRGREIAHPEIGRRILERLISEISELAVAENMPRMEGNTMHTILGPRPGMKKPAAPAPAVTATQRPAERPSDAPRQTEASPAPPAANVEAAPDEEQVG